MSDRLEFKWNAVWHPDTWTLLPTILVSVERGNLVIAFAWLPCIAGLDVSW
jgi:hypothetical protein